MLLDFRQTPLQVFKPCEIFHFFYIMIPAEVIFEKAEVLLTT